MKSAHELAMSLPLALNYLYYRQADAGKLIGELLDEGDDLGYVALVKEPDGSYTVKHGGKAVPCACFRRALAYILAQFW